MHDITRYLAGRQSSSTVDVSVKVEGGFWYAAAGDTDIQRFNRGWLFISDNDKSSDLIQTNPATLGHPARRRGGETR